MSQNTINIGTIAGDHTGDSLRTAGQKINSNFTELYGIVNSTALPARTGNNGKALFTDGTAVYWAPVVATNGVVTTGGYIDPTWITSLSYGKITNVPTATTSIAGVVQVDGTSIAINNGVISVANNTSTANTNFDTDYIYNKQSNTFTITSVLDGGPGYAYLTLPSDAAASTTPTRLNGGPGGIQLSLVGLGNQNWNFNADGSLTFPDTTTQTTAWLGLTSTLPSQTNNAGKFLSTNGNGTLTWQVAVGSGTVTSVSLNLPSQFTVTIPNVTTTGTLTAAWNTQTANYVLAGPATGSAAAPTFRALVAADIPSLSYQAPIGTISGLAKGNGANTLTAAVAGVDYQTAQSVTGIVKSSGTTRSAATAGTDYSAGTSALATGIIKSTTTTGALTIAAAADINSTFGSQTQNYVYAAPSSGNGTPSFRLLTVTDMPISGLQSRSTVSATTGSLAYQTSSTITIPAVKGYALYSIQSTVGAWVTIYSSSGAMSTDGGRSITTDPAPGSGVIAEAVTTGGTASYTNFTPAVFGYNSDGPTTNNMYLKVYNNSGSTATITVTITFLKLEV